jgi:hypothetical protein
MQSIALNSSRKAIWIRDRIGTAGLVGCVPRIHAQQSPKISRRGYQHHCVFTARGPTIRDSTLFSRNIIQCSLLHGVRRLLRLIGVCGCVEAALTISLHQAFLFLREPGSRVCPGRHVCPGSELQHHHTNSPTQPAIFPRTVTMVLYFIVVQENVRW